MIRLLHAADLHLSEAEKDYGMAVLAELLDLAAREKADFLLFCGDLFDTFPDAEALRADFRRLLSRAALAHPCEFLYLPGNHEALKRGPGRLGRLDLGPVTLLDAEPFSLLRRECRGRAVEFLAVPHQEQYAGYGTWPVPPKSAPWRIALAHGIVAGMAYRGPDAEGGGSALDPDLFARFAVDYAALGHIHGRRHQSLGGLTLAYPGSGRVWRKHESGPRGANLVELPYGLSGPSGPAHPAGPSGSSAGLPAGERLREPAFLPLSSAGEFRHYKLPLSLDGETADIDRLAADWGPRDSIAIELAGLVEDERLAVRLEAEIRDRHAPRVRALEVSRDQVFALPGVSSNPMARRFLERWQARPEAADPQHPGYSAWFRSRDLALGHIKACLDRASGPGLSGAGRS